MEKSYGDIFKGVVKNVNFFTENRLNGNLRARCSSTPPCPEPDGNECNNKGECKNIDSVGVCSCVVGYGDVACDKVATTLPNGEQQPVDGNPFLLNEKMWDYYSFEVPPTPVGSESTIIVELNRLFGDQFCLSRERRTERRMEGAVSRMACRRPKILQPWQT